MMTKTNIDLVYKVLNARQPIHPDQVDFNLSKVVRRLRREGFKINRCASIGSYRMEVDAMPEFQLAVLQKAARFGLLDEQKAAA